MRTLVGIGRLGVMVSACAVLVGCQPRGTVVRPEVVPAQDGLVVPGPFAPATLRVHPLTHAEIGPDGSARVTLHVELKDAWGDTVKGVGQIQAQLWRDGTEGDDRVRWDVDLRALGENASFYDPATRTYRITLGGLPAWLDESVRSDETLAAARVRVLFRTADVAGRPVVLRDEFVIRP